MPHTIIYAYSRAQAIEDGVLIDVSDMAREAGFTRAVALTRAVWESFVRVPERVSGQDEKGRLWDVLWMLRVAILNSADNPLFYSLLVQNDDNGPKEVRLKAVCGPGDEAEPVITVMLPEED